MSSSPGNPEVQQPFSDSPASLARDVVSLAESHASESGSEWFEDLGALPGLEDAGSEPSRPAFLEDAATPAANASETGSPRTDSTAEPEVSLNSPGTTLAAEGQEPTTGSESGGSEVSEVILERGTDPGAGLSTGEGATEAVPGLSTAGGLTAAEVAVETLRSAQGPPESVDSEGVALPQNVPAELDPTIPPDRPILIVHGIGGSFPSLTNYPSWLIERGYDPELLLTDPLMEGYEILAQSLILSGYKRGETLFEANYDWRVTPGPTDTLIDGVLHNADGSLLTADQITDDVFEHGVDYFGYWVSKAALEWASRHAGVLPESVDVIAHSTGGLVVRAYMQSASYGGSAKVTTGKLSNGLTVPAGTKMPTGALVTSSLPLPKINDLVTMGVPMRGASGPFQLAQDDWGADTSKIVLGKVMAAAYENYFLGVTIEGPGETDIPGYVGPDFLSPVEFIERYCPTLVSLTATYPFVFEDLQRQRPSTFDEGVGPVSFNATRMANRLAMDLNDGLDLVYTPDQLSDDWSYTEGLGDLYPGRVHRPTAFVGLLQGNLTVVYSETEDTPVLLTRRVGSAGIFFGVGDYDITPFCNYTARLANPGEVWYISDLAEGNPGRGDESVPTLSAIGLYAELEVDGRVDPNPKIRLAPLARVDGESNTHVGMLATPSGIRKALEALGRYQDYYVFEGKQKDGSRLLAYTKNSYNCTPPASESPAQRALQGAPAPSPIATFTSAQLGAVADGLLALKGVTVSGYLAGTALLGQQVALLGRTIGEGPILLSSLLDSVFLGAAAAVRALPSGTDSLQLMEVLGRAGLVAAGGFVDGTQQSLSFVLSYARSIPTASQLVLGSRAIALGIEFGTVPVLPLTDFFSLVARVRLDLTESGEDLFGVVDYTAAQGIQYHGYGIAAAVNMGTLGSTPVTDGEVQVDVYAQQKLSDPSGDRRLTGSELAAAPIESISTVAGKGETAAALPTATPDAKVVYASATQPFGTEADVVVGSLNFEAIKERLTELLDGLAAIGDALENPIVQTALQIPLPFLDDPNNNTLDELLTEDTYGFGLDEFFDLVDVLRDYCDQVSEPNLRGFVDRLAEALRVRLGGGDDGGLAHGPVGIRGGFDVDGATFALVIEMDLERTLTTELTEEGFGPEASGLGLDLAIPVEATLGFESEVVLAMDLESFLNNPSDGISKTDVSLEINRLRATFGLSVPDLDTPVTLGFLTAGIEGGSAELDASVEFTVAGGNPLDLATLQSVSAVSWILVTPPAAGRLSVSLPLSATVGGTDVTADCSPTITIVDANIFDAVAPTVATADFDCLRDFCNITPQQVLGMLKGLGDWLAQFRDSSVFETTVPFSSGTTFGDLFDFSTAFVDRVYNQLVRREIVASGAQTASVSGQGRIAFDTEFEIQLDDLAAVGVSVRVVDTSTNTSLEDLIQDFDAAFAVAGLGASVEAVIGEGRKVVFRTKPTATASRMKLTVRDPDGISSTPNTNPMVAEIGFSATQYSVETPDYSGIEDFSDQLSEALAEAGVPLDVNLVWDEPKKEIRMEVAFDATLVRSVGFEFDPDLGLGPLVDAEASGTFTFTADLHAGFVLGFDLNPAVTPRLLTNALVPPPSTGVLTRDAHFTLKLDDDRYEITVPRDDFNVSLAHLVEDINAQFTSANGLRDRVIAQVSGNGILLAVLDEDTDGDGVFDAGEDSNGDGNFDRQLGVINSIQILGDTADTAFNEMGFVVGQIDRADVVGLFVDDVVLEGSATLEASGLEASFRFGVFSIALADGEAIGSFSITVALESPTGGTRFTLGDLKLAAPDFGTLLKVAPVWVGSIDIRAPTLTLTPDMIDLPAGEPMRIYIPDLHFPEYNAAPYHPTANARGLFVTLPTVGGLGNFSCLTFLNIVQALDSIADELEAMQGFGFLGQPIPLINLSIGDLLDTAGNFAELVEGLATADADTIATLEADLEAFFGVSDPRLITLSVDDYSPGPFLGGTATTPVVSRFNPSGQGNAIVFSSRDPGETYRDTKIELVDDGRYTGIADDARVEFDSINRILRIFYHAGYTTAGKLVAVVNAATDQPFRADLDTVTESGTGTGEISVTALRFSLHYNLAYGNFLALDLDLDDLVDMLPAGDPARDLLGGISSFVQLGGSANLNVTAEADFLLEFGIDVSNPCLWVPFLYDTTAATLTAAVRGTDIAFTASVGPLGVFVKDGTVTVDRDGDPDTTGEGEDAEFAVTVADTDGDGRHYLRDGLSFVSDLQVNLEAGASAELPLCFPTESLPVGSNRDDNRDGHPDNELVIEIPSLPDLFDRDGTPVRITTPDLAGLLIQFNVCDLVTNASVLLDGLDALLGMLQDGLQSEVLNRNLPLVGDDLAAAGNFIEEFREGLLADIRAKLATVGDPIDLVKQAFWNVLGKPGLNLLVDEAGVALGSVDDIDIGCVQVDGEVLLLFNVRLGRVTRLVDTSANPIDLDIGIPGLGLEIDGNVKVELGFTLNLFFGLSTSDGFFFDTDGLDDASTADDTELTVFFRVTVPGLSATGNLLFLQAQVSDESDGVDADGNPRNVTLFDGHFSVNVVDGGGRLSFSEMMGGGFNLGRALEVTLTAKAEVHLDFDVSFGDDARFPRMMAEFDLVWCWDPSDGTGVEGGDGDLEFGFHNLRLDLGSFIAEFLVPILEQIKVVVEPAKPLIDLLTMELPIFSDLNGGPLTLLKLGENAGLIAPSTRLFIEAVDSIFELVTFSAVTPGGGLTIDLGSFDLLMDALGNIGAAGTLSDDPIDPEQATTDPDAKGFLGTLQDMGFTFPFLKVSELFKLFTGQPVSFVEFHMPLLEFEASVDFQIPIFPPLYIIFGGSIGARIDLTFGYDTLGLQTYFSSPDKNLADLFQGFYVKDVDDYGNEITELTLSGGLFAGAELDILIASAGVTGGIYADVLFDLRDNDDDGRVRVSEIVANAEGGPLCIFDVDGRIYVSLDAFLEVNLLIAKIDKEWNFGEITLLEFGLDCPQPELASFDTDGDGDETEAEENAGQLVLHIGEFAYLRKYGDTADGNERFTVRSLGPMADGSQSVEVSFGGIKQTYHGVKSIVAEAGAGNDTVDLTGVWVPATVHGGDGDDTLKASRGGGEYHGDDGNDTISSEAAASDFLGVDDVFHGGNGNDTLTGREGNDTLHGDDGNDVLWGGGGNDTLNGDGGNDDLDGDDGRDTLNGDEGVDSLVGGEGNDTLKGGEGDDGLEGGEGDDKLVGNAGNDFLDGGNGDDVLVGDEGTIGGTLSVTGISGDGDDTLVGGPGNDTLIGAGGDDALFGGNHIVSGVTTAVTVAYRVTAGGLAAQPDGADFLDGGLGNDILLADDAHSGMATSFAGAEVGDRVWLDLDQDGIQDATEPGVGAVSVELHRSGSASALARTVTDATGAFRFAGLPDGDYFVRFQAPKGMSFTTALVGGLETDSDAVDTDGNGIGDTAVFHLGLGASDLTLDAGVRGATPTLSIADASIGEGDEGSQYLTFVVSLSNPASEVVTVGYRTGADSDGDTQDAVAGKDYRSVEYTLVFQPGSTQLEVLVPVVGDTKDELDEVLVVTLYDAYLLTEELTLADASGVGTIVDDDDAPTVAISDASVYEADGASTVQMVFTVTLSNPSWRTLTVDWRLLQATDADGSPAFDTATVGVDYTDETGSLTFPEDTTSLAFDVTIRGDDLDEYDERLFARIARGASTPSSSATVTDDTGLGTVYDDNPSTPETTDDDPMPGVSLRVVGPARIDEGHAGNRPVELALELDAPSGRAVSVTWNTNRGTALDTATLTDAADFEYTFRTASFEPGVTTARIEVNVYGDTTVEPNEFFFVNLLSAINAEIGTTADHPNHEVITIRNDESTDPGPWYVQFSDDSYTVTEGGLATITLVRAGDSSQPVAVYWAAGGTATPGDDYDPALNPDTEDGRRGLVRFGPGEVTKTFTLQTYDNLGLFGVPVYERDETVLLHLANPTGGAVRGLITEATLTILNDDPAPVIVIRDADSTGHFAVEQLADLSAGTFRFEVSVSGVSEVDVSVRYTTVNGTAVAEDDFITKTGVLTFLASDLNTPQFVTVTTKPDGEIEEIESLFVVLSDAVHGTIGDDVYDSDASGGEDSDDRGYGIILDDDLAPASGVVFLDSNGNGFRDGVGDSGLAGVKVTWVSDTTGTSYSDTTDTSGAYSLLLPLDDYTVSVEDTVLPEGASATTYVLPFGYALAEPETVVDLGFEVSEAPAMAEGSTGSGTSGNNDTVYGGSGNDELDGGDGDDWLIGGHWLGPGGATELPDYDLTLKEIVSGSTRTRVYVDPASMPAPGTLNGRVWIDSDGDNTEQKSTPGNERGLSGVQVNLYDASWTLIATAYTDTTGAYTFGNLAATDYRVHFLVPGGYALVTKGVGGSANDSDADVTLGLTDAVAIAEGRVVSNVDAGVRLLPAGTAPWNVSFARGIYSVRETDGFAVVSILGDGVSVSPVGVFYTSDGSAVVELDYTSARGIVRFGPGESEKWVVVGVVDDELEEAYETLFLTLKNPTGGEVGGAQRSAVVLIFDDPGPDDDIVVGDDGDDVLLGDFGWFTDAGEPVLLGGMGNDELTGGEGDDRLEGEGGHDTLEGGAGDDVSNGGSENDRYRFDTDVVLGTDTLGEGESPLGGADTLDFSGSGLSLTVDLAGTSLTIRDGATTVLVLNYPADVLENVLAGSGNDVLRGNLLDNVLDGGLGDDVLEGRRGDDDLTGGEGDDLYVFDADGALGHDDLFEPSSSDTDTIDFGDTTAQAVSLDLRLTTSQVVSPTLTLTLNAVAPEQQIVTLGGSLLVVTRIQLLPGTEVTPTSSGFENLYGGRYAPGTGVQDRLSGNNRDNVIWGREGNDVLDGGSAGYDTLKEERAGNWNLNATSLVDATSGETDTFTAGSFDEIRLTGDENANHLDASSFAGVVWLDGAGGADTLVGGGGTNFLTGGPGADRIDGSRGTDTLTEERDAHFTLTPTSLVIGTEIDILVGTIEQAHLIGGEGANTLDASTFQGSVTLEGRGESDTLLGTSQADVLEGGAGDDAVAGRGGDDVYRFDADQNLGTDTLTELPGGGIDTLDFSGSEAMGATVSLGSTVVQRVNENLSLLLSGGDVFESLTGSARDDDLSGNALANIILGLAGSDRIQGGLGADTLDGGAGVNAVGQTEYDTLVEIRDADITLQSGALLFGGGVEDILIGFEAGELTGGAGGNTLDATAFSGAVILDGAGGDDVLRGGAGDDVLKAGAGADSMSGGYGNDTYRFDADVALGSEVVDDAEGIDWLDFSGTSGRAIAVSLGVATAQVVNPNLTLTLAGAPSLENVRGGDRNDDLTGNALDNTIEGGEGRDRMVGAAGDDLLRGGNGDDDYVFGMGGAGRLGTDTILEEVGTGGSDTLQFNGNPATGVVIDLGIGHLQNVHADLGLYLIRPHSIENVLGTGAADTLVGNSLANRLEGRGGDDILEGGLGDDVYAFDADTALGTDTLIEEPLEGGWDTLDFAATSGSVGSPGTPLSLTTSVVQVVNGFLSIRIQGGSGFDSILGGSGSNHIATHGSSRNELRSPSTVPARATEVRASAVPAVPIRSVVLPRLQSLWKVP